MSARGARLAAVWAGLAASAAFAQINYLGFKMLHDASDPFKYYTDSRTQTPVGLNLTDAQSAVKAAWDTWGAVSCSRMRASNTGGTTGVVTNVEDPFDLFSVSGVWLTSNQDQVFQDLFGSSDVISISVPVSYAGVLQTCDTYLNGVDHPWSVSTPTPTNDVDVQSAMVHEAGHCMGFGHFGGSDQVMNTTVPIGDQRRVLGSQDIQAICDYYPAIDAQGAPCDADGGCGSASLQCATQTIGGVTSHFCTSGCTLNTGAACDIPLVCTGSTMFSPTYNGACLRPDNSVTLVGAPCTGNTDCGSSVGVCQAPGTSPSMNVTWQDGYCTQTCLTGQTPCPANSACTDVGAAQPICLEGCRVGFADCRPGYSCAETINGGVCIPSCYADADCGDTTQYQCRVCDGLCVPLQNPTGQIGEVCTDSTTCGPGQTCANLDTVHTEKMCTTGCSRGCATCPNGSSCHPLPSTGELLCLRDCSGVGTCPTGTQCASLPTGHACMPACQTTSECPVGLECLNGECQMPGGTGGGGGSCTGAFCPVPDSGHPLPKTDGGHGGGGTNSGGCGCQNTDAGNLSLLAGFLLALALVRRQRVRVHRAISTDRSRR